MTESKINKTNTTSTLQTMSSNSNAFSNFHENDVLLGRGGSTNKHRGNQRYRGIVADHQPEYLTAKKKDKVLIARQIVSLVQNSGGRFLKLTPAGVWEEVTNKRAQEKTSQALREGLDVRARMGTKTRPPQFQQNHGRDSTTTSTTCHSSSTRKRSKASLARATARLAQHSAAVTPGTSIPTSPIVSPSIISQVDHSPMEHEALWMPRLSLSVSEEEENENDHHLATMPPVVRPMSFLAYADRQFSKSDVKDECAV